MPEESSLPLTLAFDADDPRFLQFQQVTDTAAVSERFEYTLRAFHRDPDLEPKLLIGRRAKLTLLGEPEAATISGIIVRARQLKRTPAGDSHYELVLGPRTDWMKLRRDARIFKDAKATDIACSVTGPLALRIGNVLVFDDAGLPVHDYRVQYNESDWDAFKRLLADDGVSFLYDHTKDSDVFLVPDLTTYRAPTLTVPFLAPGAQATNLPHIREAQLEAKPCVGTASVADAWPDRPDFDAKSGSSRMEDADLEHYAFDAAVDDKPENLDFEAKRLLLEEACTSQLVTLVGNAFVQPGARILLENAPRPELAVPLVVLAVDSEWVLGGAGKPPARQHRLRCIPADRPYAPERRPKPRIDGVQRAIVTGEGEIDPDEHGRVLCLFHWDRNKVASRRVPVSQGWAGPSYGLFTQPRVGDEVIVAYLDGDPDELIIVGRVHNAKNVLPVTLPAEKTVSVWRTKSSPGGKGFNEIRMDDKAGEELFSIHAQRDYRGLIERDFETTIGRNEKVKVLGEHRTDIVGTNDVVCGSRSSFTGPEYYLTTNFTSLAASDQFMITTGKFDTFVQGSYKITANDEHHYISDVWEMMGPRFQVTATSQIYLSIAGGASISITAGEIRLSIGGSTIVLNHGSITAIAALIDLNP